MAEADPAIPEPSAKEAISFEANQVLKEIGFAVERVEISKELPSNESVTYLNLVTREKETYCVELSTKGYRVRPTSSLELKSNAPMYRSSERRSTSARFLPKRRNTSKQSIRC